MKANVNNLGNLGKNVFVSKRTLPECVIRLQPLIILINTHFIKVSNLRAEHRHCTEIKSMLIFEERGKPEYPEKTCLSKVENQQTQPTYDAGSGNQTRDTLVEGERSRHCAIPARHSV